MNVIFEDLKRLYDAERLLSETSQDIRLRYQKEQKIDYVEFEQQWHEYFFKD